MARVRLDNPENTEPQFVPGIGVMEPGEWYEVNEEEFKAVNGFDLTPTNRLEIEGVEEEPATPEEGEEE